MQNLKQQINTDTNSNPDHIHLLQILYDNCVKMIFYFKKN